MIGPLIAAAGFFLFPLPSVRGGYWSTFFPAFIVLGFGMAVSVAPLTTVVMGSVDPDRSGTASGINNAVARVAGVLAIAVLGIAAVKAFSSSLNHSLARLEIPPRVLHAIQSNEIRLAGLQLPAGLDADTAAMISASVSQAFVFAFRTFELKSSLRWNIKAQKIDKEIENAVLKTIVAFCNTDGGELLIGVADDKTIIGIEHDAFPNDDKFQLHLRNLLLERIIPSVAELVSFEPVTIDGKTICHVTCKPSKRDELWLKPDKNSPERFYVRLGPSSTELQPRDALAYIRTHFQPEREK